MREIALECANDLFQQGVALWEKMTAQERAEMSRESYPYRLPKAILVALVANGIIDRQWNAEGIKRDVARLRKIERRY
jgi:hypothetical protein